MANQTAVRRPVSRRLVYLGFVSLLEMDGISADDFLILDNRFVVAYNFETHVRYLRFSGQTRANTYLSYQHFHNDFLNP